MIEVPCRAGRTFSFDPATTARLIVDMQYDFVADEGVCGGGHLDLKSLQACVPRVRAVLDAARELAMTVAQTRYGFKPDLSNLPDSVREQSRAAGAEQGTPGRMGRILTESEPGFQILPELTPAEDKIVVNKPTFGAFASADLHTQLQARGVRPLLICGVTTECCVEGTIREAVDLGYYVMTLEDCCGAFEPELHEGTMRAMQSEGHLFGWTGSSEARLAALPASQAAEYPRCPHRRASAR